MFQEVAWCENCVLITLFSGLFLTLPTAVALVSLFPCSIAAQPGPALSLSSRARTGCSSPTGPTTEHWTSEEAEEEQHMHSS